jgi:hypothetical protein
LDVLGALEADAEQEALLIRHSAFTKAEQERFSGELGRATSLNQASFARAQGRNSLLTGFAQGGATAIRGVGEFMDDGDDLFGDDES